jgi:hypothetical protein
LRGRAAPGISFPRPGEATGGARALLDEDGGELIGSHAICYDYLTLAVGSVTNDFGTSGVAANCLFLDGRAGADRFRTACSITACACPGR